MTLKSIQTGVRNCYLRLYWTPWRLFFHVKSMQRARLTINYICNKPYNCSKVQNKLPSLHRSATKLLLLLKNLPIIFSIEKCKMSENSTKCPTYSARPQDDVFKVLFSPLRPTVQKPKNIQFTV